MRTVHYFWKITLLSHTISSSEIGREAELYENIGGEVEYGESFGKNIGGTIRTVQG